MVGVNKVFGGATVHQGGSFSPLFHRIDIYSYCVTGIDPITIRQSLNTELVAATITKKEGSNID